MTHFIHPDDYTTDDRPYCSMRSAAEASNQDSGHARSCADGAGGDCTCGLIDWSDELMDSPEEYDHPLTLADHEFHVRLFDSFEEAREDGSLCECGVLLDYHTGGESCIPF